MSSLQIHIDEALKKSAYRALEKLNISPPDAVRFFLRYVAEHQKLPFPDQDFIASDEDQDILNIARERIKNPAKRIKVTLDDI